RAAYRERTSRNKSRAAVRPPRFERKARRMRLDWRGFRGRTGGGTLGGGPPAALLHRRLSWFTGFAGPCKPKTQASGRGRMRQMEWPLRPNNVKPRRYGRVPMATISLLAVSAALSGCNTSKTFAGLKPGETITQGYVIDQEAMDLVPVGSSREQVVLALGTPSTTATFDNEVLYYISQTRKRPVAF